jgi:hypothetical protein
MAVALAATGIPFATTVAHADEHHKKDKTEKIVELEDVPKPAQDAIKREIGDSPILKVEEETYADGKVVYEAEVRQGHDVLEVKVDPSGNVVKKELKKHK